MRYPLTVFSFLQITRNYFLSLSNLFFSHASVMTPKVIKEDPPSSESSIHILTVESFISQSSNYSHVRLRHSLVCVPFEGQDGSPMPSPYS